MSLGLEVFLRSRTDPLFWPMRMDVPETVERVEEIMDYAYMTVSEILNDNREKYLLLIDERCGHHMVVKEEIQAISMGAPDQASLHWVTEKGEGEE